MPRVPQHRRKITPSARVGGVPIPADVARRGAGVEAGGLAALGRGISTLGRFLFRIKSDQIALNDSIAEIEAGTITDATDAEILEVRQGLENKLNDKGVSTYTTSAGEIYDTNFEKIGKLNVSDRRREIIIAKWEADRGAAISRANFASIRDTQTKGKASLELLIKSAIITDDPQKSKDADEMLNRMGPIIWGTGKDNERIMNAELARWGEEAQKEKIESIIQDLTNRAAVRPELMKSAIDAELNHRAKRKEEFGVRWDGRLKGKGFLGILKLKGGGFATEYSVGVQLEANEGRETEIPTLVPTLTKAEIDLMVNDIIPNNEPIPDEILQKAVDHANKRVRDGKSPFADEGKKPEGITEFELLSNTELESVRDYANSVGEKAKSDSAVATSATIEDSYARIIKGETDIASMITTIQADPTISDDDSNTAAVKIRTFFSTWNSTVDTKEEKIITSNSTRIKALKIKNLVRDGKLTEDEGLEQYIELEKSEKINFVDNKSFINDIFAASKIAEDVKAQQMNSILAEREKQLRDAIEKQQNILDPDIATEILKDFANVAVIEFNDKFREGEFNKKEVDDEVNRLMKKYTLSEAQQQMAAGARALRLAETLKVQQEQITKIVAALRREGKTEEAKAIMDEAITLGIFLREGETITKSKGKKKVSIGRRLLDRLTEQFR